MKAVASGFRDEHGFTHVNYAIPARGSTDFLQLKVSFARCRETPLPFRAECVRQAKRLAEVAHAPILVHMSGGIDSEIVARSFLEARVPFRAVSFVYASGNDHDLAWAREFCRRHGIEQSFIPLDDREFLPGEALRLMHEFAVNEPFPAFEIKRLALSEGYVVMGNGDPHLVYAPDRARVELVDYYGDLVSQRWLAERGRRGCPKFFRASPEIFLSFLLDPLIQIWLENCADLKLFELGWWKYYIYKKHWPDLVKRPKATGYELFARAYSHADHLLETEFPYQGYASRVGYAALVESLKVAL